MRRFAFVPLPPLQFLDRGHDPLPDVAAAHVALLQHGVRPLGSLQGGARAVLADQHVGGAVDVEVGGHDRRTSSTADRASEAVRSAFMPISSALRPTADVVRTAHLGLLLTQRRSGLYRKNQSVG